MGNHFIMSCDFTTYFQGINVPCIEKTEPQYGSRSDDNETMDHASLNLMGVFNSGTSQKEGASDLTLRVIGQVQAS